MSDSSLVPKSAELATTELPAWVVPATPKANYTTVGVNNKGELYIYGPTSGQPGPVVSAILGQITSLTIAQHAESSKFGARPYLELYLATPIPGEIANLRVPCKESPSLSGEPSIPWSARSLVSKLLTLDLRDTAVKLQTERGTSNPPATFFVVTPHDTYGNELPEVRAESIGPRFGDLEIAVDHLRRGLGLPPLTPDIAHDV